LAWSTRVHHVLRGHPRHAHLRAFFCGWACHIVALQDFCAWIMKKVGVHPKPWRSRLLLWVPLGLAVYMFVWPTFRREAPHPLAHQGARLDGPGRAAPRLPAPFRRRELLGHIPPWYVAVPTFLICGFATVYFMGAKAFCTYGCPYGGFFGPIDRIAPGRIASPTTATTAATAPRSAPAMLRVHEEVRDYGMVVDPGCMKCLDCISACPNGALYWGFGKPAVFRRAASGRADRRR